MGSGTYLDRRRSERGDGRSQKGTGEDGKFHGWMDIRRRRRAAFWVQRSGLKPTSQQRSHFTEHQLAARLHISVVSLARPVQLVTVQRSLDSSRSETKSKIKDPGGVETRLQGLIHLTRPLVHGFVSLLSLPSSAIEADATA